MNLMYDECVCNLTSLRAFPWRSALAIRAHVVRFVKNVENYRKVKTPGNAMVIPRVVGVRAL